MPSSPDADRAVLDARAELAAATARLRRLKRLVTAAPKAPERADAWRAFVGAVQALGESLSIWAEEGDALDDETAGRARELTEASRRVEADLGRIEEEERRLEERRGLAAQQLETLAHGWSLLARRRRAAPLPRAAADGALLSALGEMQRAFAACQRALQEERAVARQAAVAQRHWTWIREVAFPAFERRIAGADDVLLLPTLRRLVEEIDGLWSAYGRAAASAPREEERAPDARGEPAAEAAAAAARGADLERIMTAWASHLEALDAALEKALAQKTSAQEKLAQERARSSALALRLRFVLRQVARLRRGLGR